MRTIRWVLPLLVAAMTVAAAAPAVAAVDEPVLVVDGRGFGHGVGMAQDGAYWMGRSGSSLEQILGHFYPGVGFGRGTGNVRVVVLEKADRDALVTFPEGGEVRSPRDGQQAPGFPVRVAPGGSVRIRHDGNYRVIPVGGVTAQSRGRAQLLPLPKPPPSPPAPGQSTTTTTTTAPARPVPPTPGGPPPSTPGGPPPSTAPPPGPAPAPPTEFASSAPVWAIPAGGGGIGVPDRRAVYRGVVQAAAGAGSLRLINEVDVEQYLRGMGEVRDPSWPAASLQAQAVVARTYALRAMNESGEICDTQRCQVYLGRQAEYGAMDRAVAASAGKVLTFGGRLAAAVYSANGGGVSATPAEGFGTNDAAYPYLKATTYETQDPDPWQVRIALRDLAGRLRYPGTLSNVRIGAAGPSGRPTEVVLEGSAGEQTRRAIEVQRALGLRSTKWEPKIELAEAPPPPPVADVVQVLPDETFDIGGGTTDPPRRRRAAAPAMPGPGDDDGGSSSFPRLALLAGVLAVAAGAVGFRTVRRAGRPGAGAEP